MTYKTVLAVLSCPADVDPVLKAALNLPAGRDIHLVGCHGEPSQFVMMAAPIDMPDAATLNALYEEADRRMSAVADAFTKACEREGISFEWRSLRTPGGDSAASALSSARTADIVIARQADPARDNAPATDFETMLFEGGRPVLMIGSETEVTTPAKRVLIAWDGSREAARAVQDALPLLKAAEEVQVVVVDPDKLADIDSALPGAQIATSLDRHGIRVNVETVGSGIRSTAQVIEAHVKATNADLLVMGAYGHPRLREWLFGGVTRSIMGKVPVPTLLSR
ncbi:universal stress protein [Pseudohoeflea suaedae]|uniref:Universal stress protein n=1 Tax=Pseudohoeflea suaedae TaxID=877384 RepID=A0A4R5PQ06_9HYPH|nr:universal stress protein [Pseudohoeflea suaedae]TDH39018.1 universal stress protein [Pseudohoeflea suaedae]